MMKWAGKDQFMQGVVTTVTSGFLPAVTGIDIFSRAGMQNFFSGEYYGNKPDSSAGTCGIYWNPMLCEKLAGRTGILLVIIFA